MSDHPEIYEANLHVGDKVHPAGRLMTWRGQLHHLADYHGLLQALPEGPLTPELQARLNTPDPNLDIASHSDLRAGKRLDLIPEHPLTEPQPPPDVRPEASPEDQPRRPSVFHYHRVGMEQPHVVEFQQGKPLLDGTPLEDHEVGAILDNVRRGVGTIRYRQSEAAQAVAKMEEALWSLEKAVDLDDDDTLGAGHDQRATAVMEPGTALQHLRAMVASGALDPKVERALTRHIYEDKMAPGMGNKFAYTEFRAKNKPGTYISMDGNSFKHINDTYGHDAGDAAITAFGKAAREAMDESIGKGAGKLFRSGGDEFIAHTPSFEHAAKFARALREKLDQIPPITASHGAPGFSSTRVGDSVSQHKLSMSFGFGPDPHVADQALYEAKKQKLHPQTGVRMFEPGQEPHFAHSLVPGKEGAVPLSHEQMTFVPPPAALKPQAPKPVEPKDLAPAGAVAAKGPSPSA